MAFTPKGKHLVAGAWLDGAGTFESAPAHGPAHAFAVGTVDLVNRACEAAEDAFWSYANSSRAARAAFLRAIADEIEARAEAITEIGSQETGLPEARLQGERGRTTGQLRLFADHIEKGDYLDRRIDPAMPVYTPDDLMDGKIPTGNVVLFDDDHYYMGGVLAELMARQGAKVTLVTPSAYVSDWTRNTLEQMAIHRRLVEAGVEIVLNRAVTSVEASGVTTACAYTGLTSELSADAVVLVTSRQQDDSLWQELKARESEWAENGIRSIKVIGDAEAPGPIAWATYAGHRFARELDEPDIGDALPFRREVTALAAD